MSDTKFRSLVDELTDYAPAKDRELVIETRADHLIGSFNNLMRLIRESYDEEIADDLQKRLINSIRTEDEWKFKRKIRQIRESRNK